MAPPPGEELFRFSTVSDVHIGLETFGFLPTVHDPLRLEDLPSERCLRAAVTESVAWGSQLLAVKGDITQRGTMEEGERAAALLAAGGVAVEALVGNHEVRPDHESLVPTFAAAGVPLTRDGVRVVDVPGVRIVLFDSSKPGSHTGTYARFADDVADAVADAQGPAVLLTHHHPQPLSVAHHWPPGVPGPEARRFFDQVLRANRRVFMSTGHTHRHRRHHHGPLVITEVGSPQHYPGTWGGYVVHEGGIRQVVRRVAAPAAIAWTEATARSVLRIWKRWSPGRIGDRCFSHAW
ncbi:MAG TPA: metallophosphoesterase [Acidimicrobiales bacterium]|nr:metallophosphoesterase [Acidimicrobiales bacterium]